jgi:hypothetical protein
MGPFEPRGGFQYSIHRRKEMLAYRSAILIPLFVAATSYAFAQDFPTAPPKLKEAEAQGLQRVSMEELKQLIPGTLITKGTRGKHKRTLKPDGSADRTGFGAMESTGTWRFDEKNTAYCNAFKGKKGFAEENCFAVFRAPDGTHYFDYEIDTGFYTHVWRRDAGE